MAAVSPDKFVMSTPKLWQRCWWWLTPLGRARLALFDQHQNENSTTIRTRLQAGLSILRTSRDASTPSNVALISQILERLVLLAVARTDYDDAAHLLLQMNDIDASWHRRADLRWLLIRALIREEDAIAALDQGCLFVADDASGPERTAKLLLWAVTRFALSHVRRLVDTVNLESRSDHRVATLRLVVLDPHDVLRDPAEARWLPMVQPGLLAKFPSLSGRAYHLQVLWAESQGRSEDMLMGAEAAYRLAPGDDNARYWYGRALLHVGQADTAAAKLSEAPSAPTPQWQRLVHIAALSSEPTPDHIEPCLRILEEQHVESGEIHLILSALQQALMLSVDDSIDRLALVGALNERLAQAVGVLPWLTYNLALKDMRVDGAFERAWHRLLGQVEASGGGCPPHLLAAVCAIVLGRGDALRSELRSPVPIPMVYTDDHHFLQRVARVFEMLQHSNSEIQLTLPKQHGPLLQAFPILVDIGKLLRGLLAYESLELEDAPDRLAASDWAVWLYQRLRMTRKPLVNISISPKQSQYLHPAFLWDRAGWLQEFMYTAPPSLAMQVMDDHILLMQSLQGLTGDAWQRILEYREMLRSLDRVFPPVEALNLDFESSPLCPWWPEDSPLQPLFQHEVQIEAHYLVARCALRQRDFDVAVELFRRSRQLCHATIWTCIISTVRFAPVLDYWEGVTHAHAGRLEQARDILNRCLAGPKATEARVQLGLVALAGHDPVGAMAMLRQISQPYPPSAYYLAALIAERQRAFDVTKKVLDQLKHIERPTPSVYDAAAQRLSGALAERTDHPGDAAGDYRRAIELWPGDLIATARLARLWLRSAYDALKNQANIAPEPSLSARWTLVKRVSWATNLPLLRTLLLACADNEQSCSLDLHVDPAESHWNSAFKRLVLRALVQNGALAEAQRMATTWIDSASNAPLVAATAFVALPGILQTFYAQRSIDSARMAVDSFARNLAQIRSSLPDKASVEFWHDLSRTAIEPALFSQEQLFALTLANGSRPAAQRVLAATLSLCSSNDAQRQLGLGAARQLLEDPQLHDDVARPILACLYGLITSDDDILLEGYSAINGDLTKLPCDTFEAYLAVCYAQMRAGAVEALTEDTSSVAQALRHHPEVRRITGLAYARRAAQRATENISAAIIDLDRAMQLLDMELDDKERAFGKHGP